MPAPRKTGRERGGRKKPPGAKQGRSGNTTLTVLEGGADVQAIIPDPPCKLGVTAQEHWDGFWSSPLASLVTQSDRPALRRWIKATQELEELEKAIEELGVTTEGSTGQTQLNPLFKRVKDLEANIAKAEEQFGMTPAARLKLGIAFGQNVESAQRINEIVRQQKGALDADGDQAEDAIEAEVIEGFET